MDVSTLQEILNAVGLYMPFPDETSKTEWFGKVDSLSAVAEAPVEIPAPVLTAPVETPQAQ